jgi:hypothetical protein
MLQRDNHSPSGPLICPSCNKKFAKRQKAADHVKEAHFKLKADDGPPIACKVFLYDPEFDDTPQASTLVDAAPNRKDNNNIILSFLPRDRSMPTIPHPNTPEVPVTPPPPPPPPPPTVVPPVPPQANPLSDDMLITFSFLEPNLCCPV